MFRTLILWALIICAWAQGATTAAVPSLTTLHGIALLADRPAPDAVIWFDVPGSPSAPEGTRALLDQRNLAFVPHVLAIQTGTTVDFPNHDRVFHNVFSYHDGRRFDLGLYPVGAVRRIRFQHSGLSRLFCNIHPSMAAYIMVVDTPYFAVSDSRGHFTIRNLPTGHYQYHAWLPVRGFYDGATVVGRDATLSVRWRA